MTQRLFQSIESPYMTDYRDLIPASGGTRQVDVLAGTSFDDAAADGGLLAQLRRRWKIAVAVTLAVTTLLIGVMQALPRSYRAVGQVAVAQDPLSSEPGQFSKVGDAADVESQVLISDSSRLQEKILGKSAVRDALARECDAVLSQALQVLLAKLMPQRRTCRDDLADADSDPARTVIAMGNRFDTKSAGQSRVISLSYTSPVPETAQLLVNTLINAFIQDSLDTKRAPRLAAAEWLRDETLRLGKQIYQAEIGIDAYRRTHGLVDGQFAPIQQEKLSQLARQFAIAEAAKAEAVAHLKELEQAEASGQGVAGSSGVLTSKVITDLKQELARVTAASAPLRYAPGAAAPFAQQKVELQAMINAEAWRIAGSIRREVAAATERVDNLNGQMAGLERAVGDWSQANLAITTAVHEVKVKRELYLALSKRASELETERRLLAGNVQLVNYGILPIKPWFPKTIPFGIASLVIASGLGLLAAVLADKADTSVRSAATLEFRTGARVLACVPRIRRLSLRRLISGAPNYPALQDGIQALYAELAIGPSGMPHRLLVTSAQAGDGKTMIALALARFAASNGKQVLLIEADLRQPDLPGADNGRDGSGLLDLLRGEADMTSLIRKTAVPGLNVLRAGGAVSGSTELLATNRFSEILAAAGRFDLVIIDSPPAGILVDARLIARQVDGVLFCARWGASHEASVVACIRDISRTGGNVLGIVGNAVTKAQLVRSYSTVRFPMMHYPALPPR